ncbi:DinB family protein [Planococcus shenhongbingii]|uniref:DinB family protein n=1 Tax=Planococcus shenhongbingii TaxID=3058398 RepID=A0ABT8NCA5_9BACL|nr:DinB family protein [Planococcus sp. N017]MDN7245493.1 DinB family protein [Planococcus sp. N017]
MFIDLKDFLTEWQHEAKSTQRILDALTDESLDQQVADGFRTLGRLGWHLTTTLDEMMSHTGLQFSAAKFGSPVPDTAEEIAEAYRFSNQSMVTAMKENWTDETLKEEHDMYGEMWSVSRILKVMFTHQIHHRGQMTVLMRQAGLKVPGLYGPAKEEWAAMGAPPPEV